MKYKVTQNDKKQKVIQIHIPKEIVAEELEKVYSEISKSASMPGFRAGKAPLDLIKKRYQKEAREEVTKNLMFDSFNKAVTESKINLLGSPEISDFEFTEEKGMSYNATVNTRPEIKIKSYKGLTLKKTDTEVKDSDVDSYINSMREMSARFKTKEGKAVKGDYLIADMDCYVEGNFVEKKEGAWLYVDDDAYIPGKVLEGTGVNDEKDVEKELPEGYSRKELAGKKAKFHIKIKEVKEKTLPELNDEFAATMGKFHNMAELKEAVRENLKHHNKIEERRSLEHQALVLLDKSSTFDVPQSIVDRHLERLLEEAKKRLQKENYSEDEIKAKEGAVKEKLKEDALTQVRSYFILDEIARLENIKVTDDEIEAAFGEIAGSSGHSAEDVRKHYEDNDLVDDLAVDIRQKKVFDLIINNASIS
ncbi:MAG: trigger factor [Candidatus Omnitrophica bacterium]|nr:trigger factor [Candidatus Omnitrophota bacterium]